MRLYEVFNPQNVIESIVRDYYLDQWIVEGRDNKSQTPDQRKIVVRYGPEFQKTYEKIAQRASAVNKYQQFIQMKQDPSQLMTPLGSSDKLFDPQSNIAREIPSVRHIHITHDISLVYRIHGSNPTYVDLYGFYSHDDLGTAPGGGSKKRLQASVASRLSTQF